MAVAKVVRVIGVTPEPATFTIDVLFEVAYSGPEVPPGGEVRHVHVTVADDDTPTTLRQALTIGVLDEAVSLGFTVLSNAVLMIEWQKGS